MAYTFVPSTAASTIAATVVYGIQDELANYILQDISVSEDINTVQIPDQQGAIAQVRGFQKHWTITFTAIGNNNTAPGGGAGEVITFTTATGSFKAFVQSAERRATYNDTQKWSVTMEAWEDAKCGTDTLGPVSTTNP